MAIPMRFSSSPTLGKDTAANRYETEPVGVYYETGSAKWAIFHENTAVLMTVGRTSNVFVVKP